MKIDTTTKCHICGTPSTSLLDATFTSGHPVPVKCCQRCAKDSRVSFCREPGLLQRVWMRMRGLSTC